MADKPKDPKLQELRDKWEQSAEIVLVVTKRIDDDYNEVYVITNFKDEYFLYRYFKLCTEWHVSVDISNSSLKKCLEILSEDFEDLYPKLDNLIDLQAEREKLKAEEDKEPDPDAII